MHLSKGGRPSRRVAPQRAGVTRLGRGGSDGKKSWRHSLPRRKHAPDKHCRCAGVGPPHFSYLKLRRIQSLYDSVRGALTAHLQVLVRRYKLDRCSGVAPAARQAPLQKVKGKKICKNLIKNKYQSEPPIRLNQVSEPFATNYFCSLFAALLSRIPEY